MISPPATAGLLGRFTAASDTDEEASIFHYYRVTQVTGLIVVVAVRAASILDA